MSFIAEQQELVKTAMFNTQPNQTKDRDRLYYQHYGVAEFLAMLEAYKSAASELIEALEAEQERPE